MSVELPTKYILEIYEPEDDRCVAALYESASPFIPLCVGDEISSASLNLAIEKNRLVVTNVEHIFWEIEGSHQSQKVCISTKVAAS